MALTPNGDNLPHTQTCSGRESSNKQGHCMESEERPKTVGSYRYGPYAVRRDADNGQAISTRADIHQCVHRHHHFPVANDGDANIHTKLPVASTQNDDIFRQTLSNHNKHHCHSGEGHFYN